MTEGGEPVFRTLWFFARAEPKLEELAGTSLSDVACGISAQRIYNLFLAKARPEADFRYFSNANA